MNKLGMFGTDIVRYPRTCGDWNAVCDATATALTRTAQLRVLRGGHLPCFHRLRKACHFSIVYKCGECFQFCLLNRFWTGEVYLKS